MFVVTEQEKKSLRNAIVVIGGKSLTPGFMEKLKNDMKEFSEAYTLHHDNPINAVVEGGSAYAQLTFYKEDNLRAEALTGIYKENGNSNYYHFYRSVIETDYYWGNQLKKISKKR